MISSEKAVLPAAVAGRRLEVTDASLEWMKWLAVVGMVLDHVNWFFLASSVANPQASPHVWMNDVGRVVFPLFAFVFGVNLARVLDDPTNGAARLRRMLLRLIVAGVVAQGAYVLLRGYFWPLNVLFTFALSALVAACFTGEATPSRKLAGAVLLVAGGLAVEYWWVGIGLTLASLHFARRRTLRSSYVYCAFLVLLAALNVSLAPLAAAAVIWSLANVRRSLPRHPGALHLFYACHLWLLVGIGALVGR
jgi:uncharacterized membrane protein